MKIDTTKLHKVIKRANALGTGHIIIKRRDDPHYRIAESEIESQLQDGDQVVYRVTKSTLLQRMMTQV